MFKRFSIFVLIAAALLPCLSVKAGHITFVIDQLPDYHQANEPVYLAGSINGWTTNNPHYQFELDASGKLTLTIAMQKVGDKISFKLTKGSWQSVELDKERRIVGNRTYTFHGGRYKEYLQVGHWQDKVQSKERTATVTGDVRIFDKALKFNNEYRTIRVFIPANYKRNTERRYSVLYMFDGQNLFDAATASVGMEWQIDEHLSALDQQSDKNSLIVVGIDSKITCERFNEYTAWHWQAKDCGTVKGHGAFMSAFVVNQVKPFIDKTFRTLPQREHTFIGGSSLGGYMAIYTAVSYQYTFSKVMALSNAVLDKYSGGYLREYIEQLKKQQSIEFYLDIGSQEAVSQSNRSDLLVLANEQMAKAIVAAGFAKEQVNFVVIEGGVHDENSWSNRFINVLQRLNIIDIGKNHHPTKVE